MPQQYENPAAEICTGTYSWSPATNPTMGGSNPASGFRNLIIDRGAFRNYYVRKDGLSNIGVFAPEDNLIEGDLYSPIINATRPLALSFSTKQPNNNNVVLGLKSENTLIRFNFKNSGLRLSCIQIEYDLSFQIQDKNLDKYVLTPIQSEALNQIRLTNSLNSSDVSNFVNGLNPDTISIYGVLPSGEEELIQTGLNLTRLRINSSEPNLEFADSSASNVVFSTSKIKIKNEELDRTVFPVYDEIIFKANEIFSAPSTLVFAIKKIMFFTADRVNFRTLESQKQLPCSALGYSMNINGKFFPSLQYASVLVGVTGSVGLGGGLDVSGTLVWPQDGRLNSCNIHVKLFNPDKTTNSPGFAHSLNLHLLIVSFPMFGPLADFLLPGVLLPYAAIIIGPVPFTQQLVFYGAVSSKKTLAPMASTKLKRNTGTVTLVQGGEIVSSAKNIYKYPSALDNLSQNQFYYEAGGSNSGFQNLFIDEYAIKSLSEVYDGSPPRGELSNAVESLVSKSSSSVCKYSTYLFKNNPDLNELFLKSDPCLVFRCSNGDGYGNLFQRSGFLSASIQCFVDDVVGLFDTQLAFRIYALKKDNTDFNPNSPDAKKHTLKITNPGTLDSNIEFTDFDGTWDFDNVLVSGAILDKKQTTVVEQIINKESSSVDVYDSTFDIYCAVYCFSSPNDSFTGYNLDDYSSLNYPIVNFVVENDFLLSLPLYYRKSFNNGGFLQAIRDYNNTGDFQKDPYEYTIINRYYNGSPHDNTKNYSGVLESSTGYNELLLMAQDTTESSEYSVFIEPGTSINPTISETDYIIETDVTSRAKINSGPWVLEFQFDDNVDLSSLEFKFEIDLINTDSTYILKVLSSKFQKMSIEGGTAYLTHDVDIPFYLPPSDGLFLLKIFIRNYGSLNSLRIKKVSFGFSKTTIEYFTYGAPRPGAPPLGYYEDLPIQPSSVVGGCSNFSLNLDLPKDGQIIYDPLVGLSISGALYSPTWVVDLPENMELNYRGGINGSLVPRASGSAPYQIYFRTGTSNNVVTLDTKRHKSTGLIMTSVNVATNENDFAVKQITSESFLRFFRYYSLATTPLSNLNLVELNLQNPVMARFNELLVAGQINDGVDLTTIMLNQETPGYYLTQPSTGGTLSPAESGYIKKKMNMCPFVVFDYKDFKTYTLGVTPTGNLLYSEDQFNITSQSSNFILVEGVPDSQDTIDELANMNVLVGTIYFGYVQNSYPVVFNTNEDVLVFYVFKGENSSIVSRYISGSSVSDPIVIFDFQQFISSSGISGIKCPINQLSVCHHDIYPFNNEFYLVFDCLGKIFMLKGVYSQHNYFITSIAVLYGNLESGADDNENNFNAAVNALIQKSAITKVSYTSDSGIYNSNLEGSQRVGFVDFDGKYLGVQFIASNNIYEIVFDKSYAINGELRIIGQI